MSKIIYSLNKRFPTHGDKATLAGLIIGVIGLLLIINPFGWVSPLIDWLTVQLGKDFLIHPRILSIAYLLIITLVFFVFRINYRLKRVDVQVISIYSDPQTMFTGTTIQGKLSNRKTSIVVPPPHHSFWDTADTNFPILANAQWIADEERCTIHEAMSGGRYSFDRKFEVQTSLKSIVSAELIVVVDDFCTPILNGNRLDRKGGRFDLFRWDIKEHLLTAENIICFEIENSPGGDAQAPGRLNNPKWPEWNPYGIKYLIEVRHLR
jgi:hypothetical protein